MSSIAAIFAHPDDEILGCGATLAKLASEGHEIHVLLMADGESSRDKDLENEIFIRQRTAAAKEACNIVGCSSVELLSLPDNRLDSLDLLDLIKPIETFIFQHRPSTVFTHHSGDVNIDHRLVHDAVVVACRSVPDHPVKELLFCEIPSSTEWRPPSSLEVFTPNWYVDVSHFMAKKINALEIYKSELRDFPHPRSLKAIGALSQWRGASVGVEAAEAFILGRKIA